MTSNVALSFSNFVGPMMPWSWSVWKSLLADRSCSISWRLRDSGSWKKKAMSRTFRSISSSPTLSNNLLNAFSSLGVSYWTSPSAGSSMVLAPISCISGTPRPPPSFRSFLTRWSLPTVSRISFRKSTLVGEIKFFPSSTQKRSNPERRRSNCRRGTTSLHINLRFSTSCEESWFDIQ